jgi:DNA repair protein RadC
MENQTSHIQRYELRRIASEFPKRKITSSLDAADFMRSFYFEDLTIFESCFILLLNQANQTIGYAKISQGGITGTVVDTRIIAHYAVQSLATGVILCHNHPSGQCFPSESDRTLTQKAKAGLQLLDIALLDHIILTDSSYYSFADEHIL